jgi:hypothetical protein
MSPSLEEFLVTEVQKDYDDKHTRTSISLRHKPLSISIGSYSEFSYRKMGRSWELASTRPS